MPVYLLVFFRYSLTLTKAVLAKRYFRAVITLPRAQKVSGLNLFHTVGYHTT
jgi:hypothetical protein